ncbi:MAG: TIGR04552 family protein [Myxococcales bacterium]|nr:TIGR04552 family protein [Myxococcales bacterium]MCB9566141.1 TIGR04552 family protein [Myxococcales bacterium]MCB9703999.1 TIGR04552 family protein [Myxococcales bacterium]
MSASGDAPPPTSHALWRRADGAAGLSLQDTSEIQLLLRGQSVIDWHRLAFTSEEEVRRLLALNCIDVDDPRDVDRLQDLRLQAVRYITEVLKIRVDDVIATQVPWLQLPLIASGKSGAHQRQACVLLKVMHIIYHLDARELRTTLAISDNQIFSLVEESVTLMIDALRTAGVPIVEFSWSRKTKESLITKMLVKRETNAARVFDRLRFRLIVRDAADLVPALHIMLRRCIPFNYVVPGQTVNSLIDLERLTSLRDESHLTDENPVDGAETNQFSGASFQILNFIADLPVRVGDLLPPEERQGTGRGNVVFVLAEFQVLDRRTAETNEQGENSHAQYKHRQHQHVRVRLLRESRAHGDGR